MFPKISTENHLIFEKYSCFQLLSMSKSVMDFCDLTVCRAQKAGCFLPETTCICRLSSIFYIMAISMYMYVHKNEEMQKNVVRLRS